MTTSTTLVEGSTFCISDLSGDIGEGPSAGLFVRDTRVLSRWQLSIGGARLEGLSVEQQAPFAATFVGRPAAAPGAAEPRLVVVRRRFVGDGMREDITLRNEAPSECACVLQVRVDADFADVFEVKAGRPISAPAAPRRRFGPGRLDIRVRRADHDLGVRIATDAAGTAAEGALRWVVTLAPRASWQTSVQVSVRRDRIWLAPHHPAGHDVAGSAPAVRLREWHRRSPQIVTASSAASSREASRTSARCASSTPRIPSGRWWRPARRGT